MLILVPVLTPIVLFVIAGALHLLVMLIAGSRNSGFGGTFRVIAYAYVTSPVYWLPLVRVGVEPVQYLSGHYGDKRGSQHQHW